MRRLRRGPGRRRRESAAVKDRYLRAQTPGGDLEARRTETATGRNCAPLPVPGRQDGGPAATRSREPAPYRVSRGPRGSPGTVRGGPQDPERQRLPYSARRGPASCSYTVRRVPRHQGDPRQEAPTTGPPGGPEPGKIPAKSEEIGLSLP